MRRPPVLNKRCCRLVRDQLWMAGGRTSRRSRLPTLYAMTPRSSRTSLARKRWQERRGHRGGGVPPLFYSSPPPRGVFEGTRDRTAPPEWVSEKTPPGEKSPTGCSDL